MPTHNEDLLKEAREYEASLINEQQIIAILKKSQLRLSSRAIRNVWVCINHSQKVGHFLDERPTAKEIQKKLKEIRLAAENLKDSIESIKSPFIFPHPFLRDSAIKTSNNIILVQNRMPIKKALRTDL